MFPRYTPFLALLVPFVLISTEMADAQVTADVNPANASNNPLTPKLTFYLQNFYMPSVTEESNRDTDEVLLRLYVPLACTAFRTRCASMHRSKPYQSHQARAASIPDSVTSFYSISS
jgi:hypothetical protein